MRSALLAERMLTTPNLGDITEVDWASAEPVDAIVAGFPCQPVSDAGRRKGVKDDRWLWPHVERAVRELGCRYVFLENVPGIAGRGMGAVLGSLSDLGFDAEWGTLRASEVGAPHRRNRWFCLAWRVGADTTYFGRERGRPTRLGRPGSADGGLAAADASGFGYGHAGPEGERGVPAAAVAGGLAAAADAEGDGRHEGRTEPARELRGSDAALGGDTDWGAYGPAIARWERVMGRSAPAPTAPGRNGERLAPVFVEWLMGASEGYVTGLDLPRNAQFRLLGNGVVELQAEAAYRALAERAGIA